MKILNLNECTTVSGGISMTRGSHLTKISISPNEVLVFTIKNNLDIILSYSSTSNLWEVRPGNCNGCKHSMSNNSMLSIGLFDIYANYNDLNPASFEIYH